MKFIIFFLSGPNIDSSRISRPAIDTTSCSFLIVISIIFKPEFNFSSSQACVTQISMSTG